MTQLISKATHVTSTSSKCIDIIATTSPDYVTQSGTLKPNLSQHCPVFVCVNVSKPKVQCYRRKFWDMKHVNWDDLNNELNSTDWAPAMSLGNIDEIAEKWTNMYTSICEKHIPHKDISIRPREPEWMNSELRKLIRKRNRLYRKAKNKNTNEAWDLFRKKNEMR